MGRLIDADSVKDFFFSETSGTEETIRDLAEKHNLTYLNDVNDRVKAIYGDQMTLKDMVDVMENVIRDPGYKHPVIARILTCNEAVMWDEYRKVGTPEECLRNKDFLDFLSDKMDPDDFEMYLHIYNSLDEKGNNNDGE